MSDEEFLARIDWLERAVDRLEHEVADLRRVFVNQTSVAVQSAETVADEPTPIVTSPLIRDPDIIAQEQFTSVRGYSPHIDD